MAAVTATGASSMKSHFDLRPKANPATAIADSGGDVAARL